MHVQINFKMNLASFSTKKKYSVAYLKCSSIVKKYFNNFVKFDPDINLQYLQYL